MIEQVFTNIATIIFIMALLWVASIFIPFYGFIKKRWKGLAIGCLIQPIIVVLVCVLSFLCIGFYYDLIISRHREAAMVTVKKTDADGFSHHWYVKPNEECFYEYNNDDNDNDKKGKKQKERNDEDDEENKYEDPKKEIFLLYDVIPQDSFSVCIDDKIVIRFDLKEHKVTATEYDEPIEVVNVDWEKVSDYFEKQASHNVPASGK